MEEGFGGAERFPWASLIFSIRSFFNLFEQTDRQTDCGQEEEEEEVVCCW